jgi:hypothetical protein
LERARKIGIHVEVQEVAVEKKKEEEEEEDEDEGVDTWFKVLAADSYSVPKREEVVEGVEKLFLKEAGEFDGEKKFGVEIVWLQLPFPPVVDPKTDAYDKYNISKEPVVSQKAVEESVNLALSLLTEEGVLILVAPLGVPDWWIEGSFMKDEGLEARAKIMSRTLWIIFPDEEVGFLVVLPTIGKTMFRICGLVCRHAIADGRQIPFCALVGSVHGD